MILVSLLNVICFVFPHFYFFGVLFSNSFQCSEMCGGMYTLVDDVIAILHKQIWFCMMFHLARWS
jgi:hypothetical protein